jgi:hypothetical protein
MESQNQVQLSKKEFQKIIFIINALNQGWTIKKSEESYVFTKKHEGKKEVFQSEYLEKFIESNLDIQNILDK